MRLRPTAAYPGKRVMHLVARTRFKDTERIGGQPPQTAVPFSGQSLLQGPAKQSLSS